MTDITDDFNEMIVYELSPDTMSDDAVENELSDDVLEEKYVLYQEEFIDNDYIVNDTILEEINEDEIDQKPVITIEENDGEEDEEDGFEGALETQPEFEVIAEPDVDFEVMDTKPIIKKPTPTGPKRYLLFDELIATIVEYDDDDTPIVEFTMASSDVDEKLPVECGICPDVMHKSKLATHLKTHLVPGTNRYLCIYCTETYKDYKYLAGHARRHMGIRPYVCDPCKLYFSTKQDLRVHNQRRHQEKEHICEICGKTFSQNTMLKRHRESTHEKKRRFQCEHCPKAYYKNFSLQEHIRNVHMGHRRMLVCQFCGMQCRDAHKMARHRKELHLNQKHFECSICQEQFTDINYFDAHKRSIQCRNNTQRKIDAEKQLNDENKSTAGEDNYVFEITLIDNIEQNKK